LPSDNSPWDTRNCWSEVTSEPLKPTLKFLFKATPPLTAGAWAFTLKLPIKIDRTTRLIKPKNFLLNILLKFRHSIMINKILKKNSILSRQGEDKLYHTAAKTNSSDHFEA